MSVTNKATLIEYIKRQLGAPVLHIEIANEQINDVIDDALDLFHEFHVDALKEKWISLDLITGTQAYTLPDNTFAIVDVFGHNNSSGLYGDDSEDQGMLMKGAFVGNTGLFCDDYSAADMEVIKQTYAMYRAETGRDYLFNYSYLERELTFTSTLLQNETVAILAECYLDNSDKNYSSLWFRKYCTAMTGILWSGNIGKYSGTNLPGGSSFNYSDIFNKYDAMRIQLEEEILDRYSDSFFMEIG